MRAKQATPNRRGLLAAVCLLACSRPHSVPNAPQLAATDPAQPPSVRTPGAPPSAWIRFQPEGTYFCVRLPDGSLRSTAYGVGGNRFVLHEGIEVAHAERDALCTNYGLTVLGARGQLATTAAFQAGHSYYTPELIEPRARSLGVIGVARCWVDDSGTIDCMNNYNKTARERAAQLNALGAVDHLVPTAPCAVYRDGQVACLAPSGPSQVTTMFTNALDASIAVPGIGCALLRSGKVACVGANPLTLRSFTDAKSATPVEIAGLDGIEEVAVGRTTACARRAGAVWCWGEAAWMQAGSAAFDASRPMPKCIVDDARTKQAAAEFAAAQQTCSRPRPPGDDPLCRSMWGATPPGKIFRPSTTPCDPADGESSSRWVGPTRVDGIDDAIAIASNGGLTCALRSRSRLTCWGNRVREPKTITFPPSTLAADQAAPDNIITPMRPSLAITGDEAYVTSVGGVITRHRIGATLGRGQPLPAGARAVLAERGCVLGSDGKVECSPPPNTQRPVFPDAEPDGVRMSLVMGLGCIVRRDGSVSCGNATTRDYAAHRIAMALAAIAPVTRQAGLYALYHDGTVRECVYKDVCKIVVRWTDATMLSASGYDGTSVCVVRKSGGLECVSHDNRFFQRGDETQTPNTTATALTTIPRARDVAVSTAGTHVCALTDDGNVWCWGRATNGELGETGATLAQSAGKEPLWPDQRPTTRLAQPVQVPGIAHAVAIAVGDGISCALVNHEAIQELACWGGGSPKLRRVVTTIE